MPSSSSSAQRALETLGIRLREIRIDASLTGRALGELTGWHSSKISKIEHGRQAPSASDIRLWCEHCGAPEQAADLVASLRSVEGMFVDWRLQQTGFQVLNRSLLPLWERTRRFRIYSPWLVPGPLQTQGYIAAILTAIRDMREVPDDVETTVQVRLDRQQVIYEGDRRFAVLLEESVLRYPIGGPQTMAEQLRHLIDAASLPSVSLGVIPLGADRSEILPVEGFWMFDKAQVDVELVSGFLNITWPEEIAMYEQTFGLLARQAVYGVRARELIRSAIQVLGDPAGQSE